VQRGIFLDINTLPLWEREDREDFFLDHFPKGENLSIRYSKDNRYTTESVMRLSKTRWLLRSERGSFP
jgi:hypothetical protein